MTMRSLLAVAVLALPAPALAQHDHSSHAAQTSEPDREEQSDPDEVDHSDHSANGSEGDAKEQAADPHAGHMTPAIESDPHAGHTVNTSEAPKVSGPPTDAFKGPENAADAYFGDSAMAQARRELSSMHGAVRVPRVLIERLEARFREGEEAYLIDGQAWYGGDIDKLWIKAEGEGTFGGDFEGLEMQALWSHAIGPWFDLQSGVRYDFNDGPDHAHLVLGVQGLAPYWIEVDAAAFLSDKGDLTAKVEVEHDARITQTLILQPRAELAFAMQDIPDELTESGLVTASIGARLRYQVTPLFAPYLGVEYDRTFDETRDLRRAAGDGVGGVSFVAGIRTWF